MELHYTYKEFKEFFGIDSWSIKSTDEFSDLNGITITLTKDIKPTFITENNVIIELRKIKFIYRKSVQFLATPSNTKNQHLVILKIIDKNKCEGTEGKNEIKFNRIITTKEL